jgi:predicted heme/steroid binding protein
MTLDELKNYDGKGADKRICIAILGKVYDCTKGLNNYFLIYLSFDAIFLLI